MATYGKVSPFDEAEETWTQYTERLEQYFLANEVTDAKKQRAIFLSVCGSKTYALIRDLLQPKKPGDTEIKEIFKELEKHFIPTPSVIVERFKFHSRIRRVDEGIAKYVAELRRMTEHCKFGTSLDNMIRDRLVCGINNEKIQRRLLAEPELTYKKAVELSLAMESASKHVEDLGAKGVSIEDPNNIHRVNNREDNQQSSRSECYRCGGKHAANSCKFREFECTRRGTKQAELPQRRETGSRGKREQDTEHLYRRENCSSGRSQGPNLFGRDWLRVIKMNWALIFQINECHPCSELKEVLETHKEVFTEELGTLEGTTAKIYANQDAQPKFVKARPVPFAMKIPLEQELERLQREGIISPVEFSDWASPIVTVAKPDGSVRVCGDYKATINQASKLDNYPIPKTEDLLTTLSGSQKFTKLDMSQRTLENLLQGDVIYCGYGINKNGIHPMVEKVEAITKAPEPENINQLRSFLGMINYYHRFLPNVATILEPLHRLLRQGTNDRCIELRTERNYSTIEKEALATIFGVKKFHKFLYGQSFTIKTDHKPLEGLLSDKKGVPTQAAPRIQRWALTLAAYEYKIQYKAGKNNGNVDALSRLPLPKMPLSTPQPGETILLMEHLEETPVNSTQIREWTKRDPVMSKVLRFTMQGPFKEVHQMTSTTSTATIEKLREIFATHGLPTTVVSDNGTNFTSNEFEEFMKRNAELLMGRHLRTQLDLIQPNLGDRVREKQSQQKAVHDYHARERIIETGNLVYAKDFRKPKSWMPGTVVKKTGPVSAEVQLDDGLIIRRHQDHLRIRTDVPQTTIDYELIQTSPILPTFLPDVKKYIRLVTYVMTNFCLDTPGQRFSISTSVHIFAEFR
ncbi:Retrovirus-related Pol poly from transposon, partial [Paramuricea clavata]